jgi:Terpene cyclase DEP1
MPQRPPPSSPTRTARLLLILTVLGFVVPNVCLGLYLLDDGFELGRYFSLWTASTPSTQLLLDLAIAALAFFVWAAVEGPRAQIARWWVCIPATLLVGLCFGLPLFLLMRERALTAASA